MVEKNYLKTIQGESLIMPLQCLLTNVTFTASGNDFSLSSAGTSRLETKIISC